MVHNGHTSINYAWLFNLLCACSRHRTSSDAYYLTIGTLSTTLSLEEIRTWLGVSSNPLLQLQTS